MVIFLIFILVVINCCAQIFLKLGPIKTNKVPFLSFINLHTFVGYALFLVSTLLSVYLLQFISFKNLTIVISLNYVGTFLLTILLLKEKFSRQKLISTTIIILGVIIYNL